MMTTDDGCTTYETVFCRFVKRISSSLGVFPLSVVGQLPAGSFLLLLIASLSVFCAGLSIPGSNT